MRKSLFFLFSVLSYYFIKAKPIHLISNFKFMSGSYEIEFQSKVHIELYCDDTNDFIHFIFVF